MHIASSGLSRVPAAVNCSSAGQLQVRPFSLTKKAPACCVFIKDMLGYCFCVSDFPLHTLGFCFYVSDFPSDTLGFYFCGSDFPRVLFLCFRLPLRYTGVLFLCFRLPLGHTRVLGGRAQVARESRGNLSVRPVEVGGRVRTDARRCARILSLRAGQTRQVSTTTPAADLGGPPSLFNFFFIFMQFSVKIDHNNRLLGQIGPKKLHTNERN